MNSHNENDFILPDGSNRIIKLTAPLAGLGCKEVLQAAYFKLNQIINEFNQSGHHYKLDNNVIVDLLETLVKKLETYSTKVLMNNLAADKMAKKKVWEKKDYIELRNDANFRLVFNDTHQLLLDYTVNNTERMLKRLQKDSKKLDHSLLKQLRLNDEFKFIISNIHSTGSDSHNGGENVVIVTFMNEANNKAKIVYKPTSILQDAMLVGDLKQLSEIDGYFKNASSMLEKLANGMNKDSPDLDFKPTTYFVLPCQSSDESGYDYGYIQFISQNENVQHKKKIPDFDMMEVLRHSDEPKVELLLNSELSDLHHIAGNFKDSDCITEKEEDVKQWSYHCGVICYLMLLTGNADAHYENMLIHTLLPYLIDNEVCLAPFGPLGALMCMNYLGSMQNNLGCYHSEHALSERGTVYTYLTSLAGNLLYLKKGNDLIACAITKDSFMKGFHDALDSSLNHYEDTIKWYDQPQVRAMNVRIVLLKTAIFNQLGRAYLASSSCVEEGRLDANIIKEFLSGSKTEIKDMQESLLESHHMFLPLEGKHLSDNHEMLWNQFVESVIHPLCDALTGPEPVKAIQNLDVPTFKSTSNQTRILCEMYKEFLFSLKYNHDFRNLIIKKIESAADRLSKPYDVKDPPQINKIVINPVRKPVKQNEVAEENTLYIYNQTGQQQCVSFYLKDNQLYQNEFDASILKNNKVGFPLEKSSSAVLTLDDNYSLVLNILNETGCVPLLEPKSPKPSNDPTCTIL